jgi:hypothetical protein
MAADFLEQFVEDEVLNLSRMTCLAYEEDVCMLYEEDTCMSYVSA